MIGTRQVQLTVRALVLGLLLTAVTPDGVPAAALDAEHRLGIRRYEHGNWSEGLTTYVSDYLYKERESAAAAKDYRLQALRSFSTLVPPEKDFPLARFVSRGDTTPKAVGYDKGMQEKPFFHAEFELALSGGGPNLSRSVGLSGPSASFEIAAASEPAQIVVDPDFDMLRRLDPSEIPPTVNALKSSAACLLVVCQGAAAGGQPAADTLAGSLGLGNFTIVPEARVEGARFKGQDVILVGYPRAVEWLRTVPASLRLRKEGFSLRWPLTPWNRVRAACKNLQNPIRRKDARLRSTANN